MTYEVTFVWVYFQKAKLCPSEDSYNTHGLNCDFSWLEEVLRRECICLFVVLFLFWDRMSLYSFGCPATHRDIHTPYLCLRSAGSKGVFYPCWTGMVFQNVFMYLCIFLTYLQLTFSFTFYTMKTESKQSNTSGGTKKMLIILFKKIDLSRFCWYSDTYILFFISF